MKNNNNGNRNNSGSNHEKHVGGNRWGGKERAVDRDSGRKCRESQ